MTGYIRRIRQLEKSIESRLGKLDIELTERCNNDCIHCCINLPANDAAARTREMTTEQVEDVLRQAAGLGCLQIRFTGGEPLLRPDFEELYVYARRLGMKVLLFTNACLVTRRLADLFSRFPPLAEIEITVYGMHAESYEAVTRTPGSFGQFRHGVDLLLEHRVPFIVKGALLPPNRHEIEEFEAWAKTIPWMTRSPGYSMFYDLRNRRDNQGKNRLIESLRLSPADGLAILAREPKKYRTEMAEFTSKFMGSPNDELFNCGAGDGICMDAYGVAQPCMGIRAPELTLPLAGAKGHFSLQAVLDQFSRLRDIRAANAEYLVRCARCFLKGLCEQCPAKSWMEHGTLDTPVEYFCLVAHAQARHLGLVMDDENAWDLSRAVWQGRIEKFTIVA